MKTKTLEDILFQVYELGVQQTDCDLTKKANTIMMLANQRVIEELEAIEAKFPYNCAIEDYGWIWVDLKNRIEELKQD